MKIVLTREVLEKQVGLIQELAEHEDLKTGEMVTIHPKNCYKLLAEAYGYNNTAKFLSDVDQAQN